jgi:hypothetical protein
MRKLRRFGLKDMVLPSNFVPDDLISEMCGRAWGRWAGGYLDVSGRLDSVDPLPPMPR